MSTNGKRPPGRRISLFSVDIEAEDKGIEEQLPEPLDCFAFTLRGLRCTDVQDWIENETAKRQKMNRNVPLSGKAQVEILRLAMAEKVIVAWNGLLDDKGKPIPYSREFARELMTNPKWRYIGDAISGVVIDRANFRAQEDQAEGEAYALSSDTD